MKKYLCYLFIGTFLISCSSDYELEKSILIYDSEFPHLPVYSEWGYNTFGAYYDRQVFISNDYTLPLKIVSKNNTTAFIFDGELDNISDSYYSGSYYDKDMSIVLTLNNFSVSEYEQLTILNDSLIHLVNTAADLKLIVDNDTLSTTAVSGEFYFKKAQHLFVDEESTEIILSGTFEFQLLVGEEPKSFTHGRFDIGVSDHNLFHY